VSHILQSHTQKERWSTNKNKAVWLAGGTGRNAYIAVTSRTVHRVSIIPMEDLEAHFSEMLN
jgi:hypothetical protein